MSHIAAPKHSRIPCPRCGVERVASSASSLCGDCRYTMSRTEIEAWKPRPAKQSLARPEVVRSPSPVISLIQLGSGRIN